MPLSKERIGQLKQQIRDRFGAVPKPLATKHVAGAYDEEWYLNRERCEELHALDTEGIGGN